MILRDRKFSEFSDSINKHVTEKGRSKSDALQRSKPRRVSFKEDLERYNRKSYDGVSVGTRRSSCVIVPKISELQLPPIVSNKINRRYSLNVSKPILETTTFPQIPDVPIPDKRALFKTRSTQNFESMVSKKANRKGGKRMRRIMSMDTFFPPPFKNRILPLLRFRRAVRTVLVLLKVVRTNEQTSRHEVLSWAHHDEISTTKRIYGMHGLSFDPMDYASRKEEKLSSEAISILSMEPEERTSEQCKLALLALNHAVKEFGEFPKAMQRSLVRVGWYEKFEDKRIIIRQGNIADNFYLILSGNAIVTIIESDEDTETLRTKAVLRKGNSFGELALMHGSRRTATVTCKNEVELLAVWREDFIDIFMPHTADDTEPDHIKFLRSVNVFREFPIKNLPYHDTKICCFTYFRRGLLLCRNSNASEWIYIIKTGSCRVLKELHTTKPPSKLQNCKFKILEDNRKNKCPLPIKQRRRSREGRKPLRCSSENIIRILRGPLSQDHNELQDHKKMLEAIYELRKSRHSNGSSFKKHTDNHSVSSGSHHIVEKTSVYVHIQTLGPKDTYGLHQIAFGRFSQTTSTILVSDGAECILINRKFFMQHFTDEEFKTLRNILQPLPTDEHLQQQLQDTSNWEAYKNKTIDS